jgi:hypothetical protein
MSIIRKSLRQEDVIALILLDQVLLYLEDLTVAITTIYTVLNCLPRSPCQDTLKIQQFDLEIS